MVHVFAGLERFGLAGENALVQSLGDLHEANLAVQHDERKVVRVAAANHRLGCPVKPLPELEGDCANAGGDEFIGMYLREEDGFSAKLEACLKKECERYNQSSGKPYEMDISVGIVKFTCQMGLEVSGVIAEADHFLYEAKRSRTYKGLRLRQGDVPKSTAAKPEPEA